MNLLIMDTLDFYMTSFVKCLLDGESHSLKEISDAVLKDESFHLIEENVKRGNTGHEKWCRFAAKYLFKSEMIIRNGRGIYSLTSLGRSFFTSHNNTISRKSLPKD